MNKIWWKQIHNVLGLASGLFLTLLLVTGILLNHPSFLEKNEVRVVRSDPTDSKKLYQGRKDGLFVSLNGGETWEEVPMLYPPEEVVDIQVAGAGKEIYVLEKWGRILGSMDGGKVWKSVPLSFDPPSEGIELKSISLSGDGTLVLATSHGWLKSSDRGGTWDQAHFNKAARPLHRLILTIHNGYFFGPKFVWVYDLSAVALLILIVSGIILWKAGRIT